MASIPFQGSALGLNLVNSSAKKASNEANEAADKVEDSRPKPTQAKRIDKKSKSKHTDSAPRIDHILPNEPQLAKADRVSGIEPPLSITHRRKTTLFQAFPKDTPEILPSNIKIELTDAQELIPEMAYAFRFGNFFSAISYDSLKTTTVASISNFNQTLAGRNRLQRQLKLFPLSWAFRYNKFHFIVGPFYGRTEFERTEFGVISGNESSGETISFNNEVLLTGQQVGLQGGFFYHSRRFSVRGFVDYPPISRLGVTEKSLFRLQNDKTHRISSSGEMGFSFNAKLDLLIHTSYFMDLNLSAAYDKKSVNYQQTLSTYDQSGADIIFDSEPYSSDIMTTSFGAGLLINMPQSPGLSPFVEAKLIDQNITDSNSDGNILVRNYLISIGFSNRF